MTVEQSGQVSWRTGTVKVEEDWRAGLCMRFMPQIRMTYDWGTDVFVDADLALDAFVNIAHKEARPHDLGIYRAHMRLATSQSETRIGFQKINFGPARLLRPLRWFDQMNPQDPLQLTEGVYALRYRYHALNNTALWLWVLYGNDDLKGNETMPTVAGRPEWGGRYQFPFLKGETALSLHTRLVDAGLDFSETRVAFDGQWDVGIGLWFESVFQYQDRETTSLEWDKMIVIGGDYTFEYGNGLYLLLEHLIPDAGSDLWHWDGEGQTTALYVSYPLNTIDSVAFSLYHHWQSGIWLPFINWQRQYDQWQLYVLGFWNSGRLADIQSRYEDTQLRGQGIQLLITFNY